MIGYKSFQREFIAVTRKKKKKKKNSFTWNKGAFIATYDNKWVGVCNW